MKFHTLIASDVDGTLIPEETTVLPPIILEQVSRAYEKGYLFMASSGRPYPSLRAMFEAVADKMAFSIVNGGGIYYQDQLRYTKGLPRSTAIEIVRYLQRLPGCDFIVDDAWGSTLMPKTDAFEHHVRDDMQFRCRCVDQVDELPEEPLKIGVYCENGAARFIDAFQRDWGSKVKVVMSGLQWIDFNLSDKGSGMLAACDVFHIPYERTIVFGDNWNDAPMLQKANQAYLMRSAKPELKALFPTLCDDVGQQLKKIISENSIPDIAKG